MNSPEAKLDTSSTKGFVFSLVMAVIVVVVTLAAIVGATVGFDKLTKKNWGATARGYLGLS